MTDLAKNAHLSRKVQLVLLAVVSSPVQLKLRCLRLGNSALHTTEDLWALDAFLTQQQQLLLKPVRSFFISASLLPCCHNSSAAFHNAINNLLNVNCMWFVVSHQLFTQKTEPSFE